MSWIRDGFVLGPRNGAMVWLPKSAMEPQSTVESAADFLRSKAAKYQTINRDARNSRQE